MLESIFNVLNTAATMIGWFFISIIFIAAISGNIHLVDNSEKDTTSLVIKTPWAK
jgi:hypothetical protein